MPSFSGLGEELTKPKKRKGIAILPDGTRVRNNSGIKRLAYTPKSYRIPGIPDKIARRLRHADTVKVAHYLIHNSSNLTRIEYEIEKDKELQKIFEGPELKSYEIRVIGFVIHFTDDVKLKCRYKENGDRKYTITVDGVIKYEKVLDSPVDMVERQFDEQLKKEQRAKERIKKKKSE